MSHRLRHLVPFPSIAPRAPVLLAADLRSRPGPRELVVVRVSDLRAVLREEFRLLASVLLSRAACRALGGRRRRAPVIH